MEHAGAQAAIAELFRRYAERQRLCWQVLQQLRPDLLHSLEPVQRPSRDYVGRTQIGTWHENGEWDYYLHGHGCRLTNRTTGEPLDWSEPDIGRVDHSHFTYWAAWLLTGEKSDTADAVRAYAAEHCGEDLKQCLFQALRQLADQGLLRYYPDSTNSFGIVIP